VIGVAGEEVALLPHRAVYWARERTLLVADLHLGKCETLKANGVAMTGAIIEEQLARLGECLEVCGAARLLVLGDLLHAPVGMTEPLIDRVARWRGARTVEIAVVPGNHDRRLEMVEEAWRLSVLPRVFVDGPFAFTHEPGAVPGVYTFAGHVHPAVTMRSGGDALKLPCFHVGAVVCVLPAFSRLTAGGPFWRGPTDRVFAIADGSVIEV